MSESNKSQLVVEKEQEANNLPTPVIEKEPVANGSNKLTIDLPFKKDVQVVVNNDKTINQTIHNYGELVANTNKKIYRSTDDFHGTDCGCGTFRPEWLQRFRSPKMFLLIFSLLGNY